MNKKRVVLPVVALSAALIVAFSSICIERKVQYSKITEAQELTQKETVHLNLLLKQEYPERTSSIKNLPYKIPNPSLDIWAKSAIIIDVDTGDILYEKNADEVIPPASMTKLVTMFYVEECIKEGLFNYDTVVPLSPETWACNMPPHSSLMFLGEGQIVTVEELLQGLSVCSGNDAATALAKLILEKLNVTGIDTVDELMAEFVHSMNGLAEGLGLTRTHFVDSSGYSENNSTTAREMATFIRFYLKNHPNSLERFHSLPEFTYPKERNLAPGDKIQTQDWSNGLTRHITMPITQKNTNPLLGKLPGCDGLKTGYIDESGYNLSLTATRNGTRLLSVTMGGPGNNTSEGQAGRVHDGTELMEWAFSRFNTMYSGDLGKSYFVKAYGAKERGLNLVNPRMESTFCVPYILGANQQENLAAVKIEVEVPDYIFGEVEQGKQYGQIKIILGEYVLDTIPLVADRSIEKSNGFYTLVDNIIK